jgi:ribose-phosphate pyrophosphokinase
LFGQKLLFCSEKREVTDAAKACKKIRQLSVAFLFAETIRRITDGESVTSLFAEQNNNF